MGEPLSLWWAALDDPDSSAPAPEPIAHLSADEQRRADRLKRPLDGDRFRAARGWLRRLLAAELGCGPEEVTIEAGEGGKPYVVGSELRFSAARSEDVALYAVSWCMEVGVDVEAIRTGTDVDGIARRFFSAPERRALAALAPDRRTRAVYECWTRKEAYVKATGEGLSVDLRSFDALPGDDGVARVRGWAIHQLDFLPGFAGAVAGAELGDWRPQAPERLTVSGPAQRR